MTSQDLVEQLLALPDIETRKRFLKEHVSLLDDQVADDLKEQADQFLRADVQRSLEMADLLFCVGELTGRLPYRALGLLVEANALSVGGLGEYQRAVALYDEAAEIYQTHGRLVSQAKAQVGKVFSLAMLGRYDDALETGHRAGQVLEEHCQWRSLVNLTMNLAVAHGRQREDAKALAQFDRARALCRQMGSGGTPILQLIEHNRAIVLRNLGQFEASIQASRAAWELADQLGHRAELGRVQEGLAFTYLVLGRYNEALELLDQARGIFLSDGRHSNAIIVELVISYCLLQLRRFADVLDKCRQVRNLFTEIGRRREVAEATLNEAVAYVGLHRYAEALASLAEARHLFEEEGNRVWVTRTDLETAAVLYHQNRFEDSLATAQECASVFQSRDLPVQEARAYLIAARAAAALNQCDQACRLVTQALAVGRGKDIPSLVYQCCHLLGSLAQAQGDLQEALAEYDQAIQELERLRGRLMVEFRAGFLEDKQVVYEDAVALCLNLDQPFRGLEYAERAKSRALIDLLAYRLDLSVQARDAEDSHLVDELTRLRSERDRLYRRWETKEEFRVRGWPTSNGDWQQAQHEVLALEKQIEELWHKLLIRNAGYARDASLWQVCTEPIQPHLTPETLLLEYFIARGELVAFLVTAEAVQARRLSIDLARVQHLIQLLWLNLRAVPKSSSGQVSSLATNARGLLQRLHELLIAPLGDSLAAYPQLIIVPHGPLHYLPLHALHDGQSFLLERHTISYLPSAHVLRYCEEARPAATGCFAVGHSYGGALPYAIQEARSIAAIFGGQAVLEDEATRERLREIVTDCRILHLAAHGDFRPDNPLFSGLALAEGWLTTLDIFNLRLNASLVTLSACQTGRNVVGGGDELLGLMRAFLYAGAASLALSLWAVEDRSTAQLMEAFYSKLAEGWTKGAALRYAHLQFIEGTVTDLYAHPYFWAPFFLVGSVGLL
jgi:CHAT domain-containing protein/predicted negative regulator of RcsB-dependent stress response